jgi:ribosomal protein S18 acetylase RimI-like enzyme
MADAKINVRKMTKHDIKRVVEVHMNAFEGFFLSSLGPRFLAVFYSTLIDDPTGISLVAYDERDIYGFVVGTTKPSRFYWRLIVSRSINFLFASLPSIIRNPKILPHLLRGFLLPTGAARPEGWGTLLSLAVAREGQNLGIGHLLVINFISEAVKKGLKKINLLTDKYNNDIVNNFYYKHDFRIDRSFKTPEGRWMNEYVLDLPVVETVKASL